MKSTCCFLLIGTIVSLLLLGSCQTKEMDDVCKTDCLVFEGRLIDANNNIPVAGALVQLIYEPGQISLEADFEVVDSTYSDENGYFELSLSGSSYRNGWGYFIVKGIKEGYLQGPHDASELFYTVDSTNFDVPFSAEIEMYPSGTLKITKFSQGQTITNFHYQYTYKSNWIHPYIQNGWVDYTTAFHEVAADQYAYVLYSYTIAGNSTTKSDSVYINAGEIEEMQMALD